MTGRVIVLGSVNLDLLARVPRLPSAGETIAGFSLSRQLGGKGANQAVAAARAAIPSLFFGAVGEDAEGAAMSAALAGHGVDTQGLARVSGPTGHALVLTSCDDNQIVVISGANQRVDEDLAARADLRPTDVCLAQLETPAAAVAAFFERARGAGAATVLNAAPASPSALALMPLVDVLIVNETELQILSGKVPGIHAIPEAAGALGVPGKAAVIVTLGPRGAMIVSNGSTLAIPGRAVGVVDTTGAGDCFCGYLAAGLARGAGLESAVVEANVAASIAVQSLGAASSIPSRSLVLAVIANAQRKDP